MIIDFHAHIFPPDFRDNRERYVKLDTTFSTLFSDPRSKIATGEELVLAMDEAHVDMAVVMGIGWTDMAMAREANDYVIAQARRYPGRLVGFCSVNPNWGEEAVLEVERCARQGVRGIGELHPDTQGFDLGSSEAMSPIMEAARGLGLILLAHASEPVGHAYPGKGTTTPDKLYAFARNFPENAVVLAHWGGGLPFYVLMPEVGVALRNVFFDSAASPLLYSERIFSAGVELAGSDRILFGTDFPLIAHSRTLKQIDEAPLDREDRENILARNAQRLLGL